MAAARGAPRRDRLAAEVRLLGGLLGEVIWEQDGRPAYAMVERLRRAMVARRRTPADEATLSLPRLFPGEDLVGAETVARAFALYFQLVNLAEERQRVRVLRQRQRHAPSGPAEDSLEGTVLTLRAGGASDAALAGRLRRLRISPVLTAHPTEARRRTVLLAMRRCARLLEALDDPRRTPPERADLLRRLREEITLLWRTSAIRRQAPAPLDEVRTAMAFFDETIFRAVPRLYRSLDAILSGPASDRQAPRVPAFMAFGSWVGADRDGNPAVTADQTAAALRIQADHVLRGYEAVATRLMQTVSAMASPGVDPALGAALGAAAAELPDAHRQLERRFPDEPYRQAFGYLAERLRRTRARLVEGARGEGGYAGPDELEAVLRGIQSALVRDGLGRVAWGEVQDLLWQVQTFGFHLAELEVRQHAAVHRVALAALADGASDEREVAPGVTLGEVLATLRGMAALQARFGVAAIRRYIVSFTESAGDLVDVLRLSEASARRSDALGEPALDLVPLLESPVALERADALFESLLADPRYRAHLAERGDRQEVMLGYSDSNKALGYVAANWQLHRAQAALAEAARRAGVELTLFHGRGGALGRGGGPAARAILGQAPGSVAGRLKVTEQGEVVAARYADERIARRHLEQLTSATLLASTTAHAHRARAAERRGAGLMGELSESARLAYAALLEMPGFEPFFWAATPIDEIVGLRLGSRPAARGFRPGAAGLAPRQSIEQLRAIPWVFAWAQARIELPGWYGLGSALEALRARHGPAGLDRLAFLYGRWPFLASLLDNAELSLARADMVIGAGYASLATSRESEAIFARLRAEHERSERLLLRVVGRTRLLDGSPVLRRSIDLRNPYVDALSALQLGVLERLRSGRADDPVVPAVRRLGQLVISGISAGLQGTG